MEPRSYQDALNVALERLRGIGFEQSDSRFATHAPMVAETLASLGFCDHVPLWLEGNLKKRRHLAEPTPSTPINVTDEQDWRSALGDFSRVADWTQLFERESAQHGWQEMLRLWWPRLLPGMAAGLTHGLIRTAHAIRGVGQAARPTPLQLHELACGMAYWASRFTSGRPGDGPGGLPAESQPESSDAPLSVEEALSDLTAANAGVYAINPGRHPVPLIHTITAPAAVRLVLPYLPADMHATSYRTVVRVTGNLMETFARGVVSPDPDAFTAPDPAELIATAVELGDEHAVKLAEAARREYALRPDPRYLAASEVANRRMADF